MQTFTTLTTTPELQHLVHHDEILRYRTRCIFIHANTSPLYARMRDLNPLLTTGQKVHAEHGSAISTKALTDVRTKSGLPRFR
jgi:hypothetical protein